MKTARLLALAFALSLVLTLSLPAQDSANEGACSVEMINGDYAYVQYGLGVIHEDPLPVLPGNHVGVWRADGEGNMTAYHNTNKKSRFKKIAITDLDAGKQETTIWGEQTPTETRMSPLKWSYTVEPNCQGTMTLTAPNGATVFQSRFVVLNGGREALYTVIIPHNGVGIGTFRRIDDFDQQLEDKVDAMAAEVAAIKEIVSAIAIDMNLMMPVPPWQNQTGTN